MSSSSGKLDDPGMMEVTGKILIATIVALIVVIVLVFLFHIYARWLWLHRQQHIGNNHRRQQDRHNSAGVTVLRRGLDASFLKTLPISQFDSKAFKDGCLECSVCLSEVQQGEDTRVLPKCHHAFHAECIDMWFHSHSTCPICRTLVSDQQETQVSVESLLHQNQEEEEHQSTNSINNGGDSFPANVLFWGDETEVSTLTSQLEELEATNQHPVSSLPFEPTSSSSSSSTSQTDDDRLKKPELVIDIPIASRHVVDNNEEDQSTPMMRSLRRILSSSRRFYPFSPSTLNNNNIAQ